MFKDKRGNKYLRRRQQPTGSTNSSTFVEGGMTHFHNKIRRFESTEFSLMSRKYNLFYFQSSLRQVTISPQAIFLHKGGFAIPLQTEFSFIWKICLHSNCKLKEIYSHN